MECIIKICANVFCIATAFFGIDGSNPVPLLYSVCIKTIDFVKHLDFIQWHATIHASIPQLPFIFFNMLQHVLSQLAACSTNTVNIGLVEQGDNWTSLNIAQVLKISKLVDCFFERIENHILDGSYPDTVPAFTSRDANPNHMSAAAAHVGEFISTQRVYTAKKAKANASPPGTPARDRQTKMQKLKPGAGSKDFTKAGLFHCKEGTQINELFPVDSIKKYYSFVCFHKKKCSKPHQSCGFEHIGRWDRVLPEDQMKILEPCHASKGKKVWLDSDIFAKHNIVIPEKFAYLLGDARGPKRT